MNRNSYIYEGNQLGDHPPASTVSAPRCALCGRDGDGQRLYVPLDAPLLRRHILLTGQAGGRRDALYQLVSQLNKTMEADDVMVLFDGTGDLTASFLQPEDPLFDAAAQTPASPWNLFRELDPGREDRIDGAARLLLGPCPPEEDKSLWTEAQDLLGAVMLLFLRNQEAFYCDNLGLRQFMDQISGEELAQLLEQQADLRPRAAVLRTTQADGVLLLLRRLIRTRLSGAFQGRGTASVTELVAARGGKRIFLRRDPVAGPDLTGVYALMLDLVLTQSLAPGKGSVYLIIDGLQYLPLPHLEDALTLKSPLQVTASLPGVTSLLGRWSRPALLRTLDAFGISVSFATQDPGSIHYLRRRYGENRKVFPGLGPENGDLLRDANVVEDWDLRGLKDGQAIVGLPGEAPFRFQFLHTRKEGS